MAKEHLAEVAKKQIITNSPETERLIDYLVRVNAHTITAQTSLTYDTSRGTFSTPLGIVTQDAITEARQLLNEIGLLVHLRDYDSPKWPQVVNQYLRIIPQNMGMRRPDPRFLYPDQNAVVAQNNILDGLEASLQLVLSGSSGGDSAQKAEQVFECKLHLVENGQVIDRIRKMYRKTLSKMHYEASGYDVHRIFEVEIASMQRAFEIYGSKLDNIWELFHGTKAGNLLSILKGGYFIPPKSASYVTARNFGNGVYFSDISTKSLQYALGNAPGQTRTGATYDVTYMLVNLVAMGKYYHPKSTSEARYLPKPGYDSSWAKGSIQHPSDHASVQNNEMIVYRVDQINPQFLIECTPGGV